MLIIAGFLLILSLLFALKELYFLHEDLFIVLESIVKVDE